MEEIPAKDKNEKIELSSFVQTLIKQFSLIKKKKDVDEMSRINVSQTVSFFALVYEKIRNAIEYREEHLIRRASIERIFKRRLMLNPECHDEAENIIRELLWARYFPPDSLSISDVENIQKIIDKYFFLKKIAITGRPEKMRYYLSQFITDLLTCEMEETLSPDESKKDSLLTFFIYQVLRKKIRIEEIEKEQKDAYFYVAVEKGYAKNDLPYLRYHLLKLFFNPIGTYSDDELKKISSNLIATFKKIDQIINNPYSDKLVRFVKKQAPPFLILYEIISRNPKNIEHILTDKEELWSQVDLICRQKYEHTSARLRTTAIRSLIYIFLTKMLLALIMEYPLSLYIYNEVNIFSIVTNTLFPPILMLVIVSLVAIPGEKNTKKIYSRMIDIINHDDKFETNISWISKKSKVKKPILVFGFTIFYALTFVITLSLIYEVLSALNFNLISQGVFIFFVSLITFFGYKVRQIAKEYQLEDKESFFAPFIYFFFMPILSLGKTLSQQISRINVLILFFDFLIEAPFKLLFGVVEEWISFVKARKDEIA